MPQCFNIGPMCDLTADLSVVRKPCLRQKLREPFLRVPNLLDLTANEWHSLAASVPGDGVDCVDIGQQPCLHFLAHAAELNSSGEGEMLTFNLLPQLLFTGIHVWTAPISDYDCFVDGSPLPKMFEVPEENWEALHELGHAATTAEKHLYLRHNFPDELVIDALIVETFNDEPVAGLIRFGEPRNRRDRRAPIPPSVTVPEGESCLSGM